MVTGIQAQKTMTTVVNQQQTTNMPLKEVVTQAGQQNTAGVPAPAPPVKSDRRSNKPIMEKRRRARINNCLNELKNLILDATKKDPARHSKLEKADILEKTVKHLQELQRQQAVMQQALDPKIINKFKAGFTECANEVSRFPDIDPQVKRRLMQHLSNCINGVKSELGQITRQRQVAAAAAAAVAAQQTVLSTGTTIPTQQQSIPNYMLPSPPSSPEQDHHHNHQSHSRQQQQQVHHIQTSTTTIAATQNGYFLPNGVQVYPTKLANGTLALILPHQQHHQQQQQQQQHQQHHHQQQHIVLQQHTQQQQQHHNVQSQLPMLVPIPNRTASTGSATSISSCYEQRTHSPTHSQHNLMQQHQQSQIHYAPPSPANSYEAMDCQYAINGQQQQQQQSQSTVIHHVSQHQSQSRQSPIMSDSQQYYNNGQQQQHQRYCSETELTPQQQYEEMDDGSAPLSLVIKKNIKEEEQPWRPW